MRKDNITNLLNLQGVNVSKHNISKTSIELWIDCIRCEQIFPCCGKVSSRVHNYYERSFNNIMIGNKYSIVHYNQRRYLCTSYGKRFVEKNTFIEKFYRHSNDVVNSVFERLTDIYNLKQFGKDTNGLFIKVY